MLVLFARNNEVVGKEVADINKVLTKRDIVQGQELYEGELYAVYLFLSDTPGVVFILHNASEEELMEKEAEKRGMHKAWLAVKLLNPKQLFA
jgi:hypothetical protein